MTGRTNATQKDDHGQTPGRARPHSRGLTRPGGLAPLRSKSGFGDRRHCRRSLNLFILGLLRLAAFAIAFSGRHLGIPSSNVPSIGLRASAPYVDGNASNYGKGSPGPGRWPRTRARGLLWAAAGRKVRMKEL